MLYRCRKCDYEEARGCLPTVTCGVYLFGLMGLSGVMLAPAIRSVRSVARSVSESAGAVEAESGLGWWALLAIPLAMVLGFVVLFVGAIVLNAVFELTEWLAYSCRRCPKCGSRRWSWGFTRGFGL